MKHLFILLCCSLFIIACQPSAKPDAKAQTLFKGKLSEIPSGLEQGQSYLSVYSHIYSKSQERSEDLSITISLRNTDPDHSLYLSKAEYYNTHGEAIKNYLDQSVKLEPLETLEWVIDQKDRSGGSGANFLFHWAQDSLASDPLFEAVMISTSGQQGLSFHTTAKRIR
ncbi:DUF3124 domain-containing protein [Croceimicrobium sp.]|uniref:DUF3124 domain-containing protein n=1 Tax=Croceimicrobium sp. TaxID=2828340 RepID=UPI003BABBD7B